MRIVSLLPSSTEIVCALGLEEQLVGVTHECDYPASVGSLPRVTRTLIPADVSSAQIDALVRQQLKTKASLYTLDQPTLEALRPDLIITQALCDVCAVAEDEVRSVARALPNAPQVLNLEPQTLAQVFGAIRDVATAAGVAAAADRVVGELSARVDQVVGRSAGIRRQPRVALLEWIDPPFSCGHWSPELVRLAGGVEGLGREGVASRTLSWDEVIAWQPEVVFVACCGFDVERTMRDIPILWSIPGMEDTPAVRSGRVFVTNGSHYFSRPGPRLVDSLEILAHCIDPAIHPLPAGLPQPVRVADSALTGAAR